MRTSSFKICLAAGMLATMAGSLAGAEQAGGEADAHGATALDMLRLGLEFSPTITVILGIFTFAGFFLFFLAMLRTRPTLVAPPQLLRGILDDIASGDFEAAQNRAGQSPAMLARVLLPGLRLHEHPMERIHQAMEGAGRREVGSLRSLVKMLANIGVLSPMLGLLGTVMGLMKAFNIMGETVSQGFKSRMMTSAIGEAMVTTALGLLVGIPAMGLYYYCVSRLSRASDDLESGAEEVAAALGESKACKD